MCDNGTYDVSQKITHGKPCTVKGAVFCRHQNIFHIKNKNNHSKEADLESAVPSQADGGKTHMDKYFYVCSIGKKQYPFLVQ